MIINHNVSSVFANRQLGIVQGDIGRSIEKLSSGQKINRAGDDASGLAVSEKMRAQIRGLNQAERNVMNGVSFIQTTEGYLQETQAIVHRLRELAVQSANGVFTAEDRLYIQVEVDQLVQEIDRIASHAQFNGMTMLRGEFADGGNQIMQLQVGANMDQNVRVFIGDMGSTSLGVTGLDIESIDSSNAAIGTLDNSLRMINEQRADLGAYQNRLEHAAQGIAIASENLQASESRIRHTNMAAEMVGYTRDNILGMAGTAMLAQANMRTQGVLQLLG